MALIFILVLNKIKKPNKGSHIDYILLYLNEYYCIIIIFKYGYLKKNIFWYDFSNKCIRINPPHKGIDSMHIPLEETHFDFRYFDDYDV